MQLTSALLHFLTNHNGESHSKHYFTLSSVQESHVYMFSVEIFNKRFTKKLKVGNKKSGRAEIDALGQNEKEWWHGNWPLAHSNSSLS